MTWKIDDPQGNEAAKISWEIVKWTRGRGLDIGAGMSRTFPHFITVDNNVDEVLFGQKMPKPDLYVKDAVSLDLVADGMMDFVFSSHLLEHIEEERLVKCLREWWRVVRLDGFMVLYLPDEDEYPKVGEEGANKDHKWNVSYARVMELMEKTGVTFDLRDFQKRNEGQEYSLYFVFQKVAKPRRVHSHFDVKPIGKTCGLVRYGAIGDAMQASSVIKALKSEGYHVTLYCAEGPGYEVLKHDPNVDDFYIQGRGQVPDQALGPFWDYHSKKYDKWVNLSESVEGGCLAMAGRIQDNYTPKVRHNLMNRNYLAYQHMIAGVEDYAPYVHFYPTPAELKWAQAERAAFGEFVIVWSLSGSSVHKTWSGVDQVVSGLLIDFPEVHVVFVGGPDAAILEKGWEGVPRVHCRAGKWEIRETLAFCQQADCIIGPETGVVNSMSDEAMPKVVFLSHSTIENLTRDWTNTHSLASVGTVCAGRGNDEAPACHRLHFGWSRCTEAPAPENAQAQELYEKIGGLRKGAGVAQCQADIGVQDAYKVIWHVVQWRLEEYAKRDGKPMPGVVKMTAEQLRATRASLPKHLQSPVEVLEEQQAANDSKSVIEV